MSIVANGWNGSAFDSSSIEKVAPGFVRVNLRLTFSGNYATGGDTLDLTNGGVNSTVPVESGGIFSVEVIGNGPASSISCLGGIYQYVPGTTLANGLLKVFHNAGAEYTAGAYGTDVTTDVVNVIVTYKR